jgi:hypothetical protein
MGSRAVFRPMTDAEKAIAYALSLCRFPPATWTKRFARDLGDQARALAPVITDRQAAALLKVAHHYRKQLRPKVPGELHHLFETYQPDQAHP